MSWLFLVFSTLSAPASAEDNLAWNPSVDLPIVLGTGTLWGALYTLVEDDLAPEGQVSHVAAMALGAARTFVLSGASPAQKTCAYAAAAVLGASAAALRVQAGVHHPPPTQGCSAAGPLRKFGPSAGPLVGK